MQSIKRELKRLLYLAPLIYVLFILVLVLMQRSLIYFPQAIPPNAAQNLADFSQIQVVTEDQIVLKGYFFPPQPGRPILTLFHGNASDPAWEAFKTRWMRENGYGILLATYRGYAGNAGIPTEQGLYKDGAAYVKWLDDQPQYAKSPRILYGESLGSGVAVEVASRKSPAALILEVPFLSTLDVAGRNYPFVPFRSLLLYDQYRNDLKIRNVSAPVLIMLAGHDNVVSLESGEALFDLANEPKTKHVFDGAMHWDIYNYGAEQTMSQFLQKVFP